MASLPTLWGAWWWEKATAIIAETTLNPTVEELYQSECGLGRIEPQR